MSFCINSGYGEFAEIRKGDYIDKSGLISVVNSTLGTELRLSCVSRPRRFGKTYAADMLSAYYDASCDSASLFDDLKIASDPDYKKHMNRYNVLHLDIAVFLTEVNDRMELVPLIRKRILESLCSPDSSEVVEDQSVSDALMEFVKNDGKQFIAIIDEWDAPIRDEESTELSQKAYLDFLRGMFKNGTMTRQIFTGVYMTGILPIKKDGSQSPLADFEEYTMIEPEIMTPYIGFTENDVRIICKKYGVPFDKMKEWYDGYLLSDHGESVHIYNSNSVIRAAIKNDFKSYWRKSSVSDTLINYINMDFDELGEAAEKLLAGLEIAVDTSGFKNDFKSFDSADDVLTLLIHLGYLSYDAEKGVAFIPNREVMLEFSGMIRHVKHTETQKRIEACDKLLEDVISMNSDAVSAAIQKIHNQESSMRYYNDEQALRAVIKLAFFTYRDHYIKMEELDSGTGYADIAFLPKKYEDYPALIVELKCGKTAESALDQIKKMKYADVVENYGSDILLVGISYDKDDPEKTHHCVIEEYLSH